MGWNLLLNFRDQGWGATFLNPTRCSNRAGAYSSFCGHIAVISCKYLFGLMSEERQEVHVSYNSQSRLLCESMVQVLCHMVLYVHWPWKLLWTNICLYFLYQCLMVSNISSCCHSVGTLPLGWYSVLVMWCYKKNYPCSALMPLKNNDF